MKKGGKGNFKRYLKEKNKLICFECGRSGHVKSECFKLKNEQWDRHKGYRAQWDGVETDFDPSKQSKRANFCFMAFEDSLHEVMY